MTISVPMTISALDPDAPAIGVPMQIPHEPT
jgi:hypothetical protein